jgi:hypothetical protein
MRTALLVLLLSCSPLQRIPDNDTDIKSIKVKNSENVNIYINMKDSIK